MSKIQPGNEANYKLVTNWIQFLVHSFSESHYGLLRWLFCYKHLFLLHWSQSTLPPPQLISEFNRQWQCSGLNKEPRIHRCRARFNTIQVHVHSKELESYTLINLSPLTNWIELESELCHSLQVGKNPPIYAWPVFTLPRHTSRFTRCAFMRRWSSIIRCIGVVNDFEK